MKYLVTGGAGFIGSNIVKELINRGEEVIVLDNFSTGKRENIFPFQSKKNFQLLEGDLRSFHIVRAAVKGIDYILHQGALPSVPRSINDPITSNDVNIFRASKFKMNSKTKINLQNPFEWDVLRSKIKKTPENELFGLASQYKQKCMLPVQSIIIQKAYSHKMHGYIMPYEEYLRDISNDDKALVYAIMRQESAFVPSALSRSFALGLMQMMPFLVDAMAKDMKEEIENLEDKAEKYKRMIKLSQQQQKTLQSQLKLMQIQQESLQNDINLIEEDIRDNKKIRERDR